MEAWMSRKQFGFSWVLAVLAGAASFCGAFYPRTFALEVPYYAAQGVGQDAVNLFLVIPVFMISAVLSRRGSLAAWLVWGGALVYLCYSYFLYCFTLHFNFLFLVYCANLGLSFYLAAFGFAGADLERVRAKVSEKAPVKMLSAYLFGLAALFAAVWLSEIIPSLVAGTVPASVTQNGQVINAVHVMDLSLALPALAVAGFLLKRRKPFGYFLAPVMLVFSIFMALAIGGMIVVMWARKFAPSPGMAGVFGVISLVSLAIFWHYRGALPAASGRVIQEPKVKRPKRL